MRLSSSPRGSTPRRAAARAGTVALAGALLAPALAGVPAVAATPAASRTAQAAPSAQGLSEVQALVRARATGKPVQASAETTATSTLTANPNGTLTLSQNLAPVRKLVHGRWEGLDASLVRNPDGTISPKVSTGSLALSGGASGVPLAAMRSGDGSLAVSLPSAFTLHTPSLSGATATYLDVLPGVDLAVTAQTSGGFSEVLVVKNAAAAKSPALADLQLATNATGVTLASDAAGDLTAKDRHGHVVFSAPAPTMWDSTPAAANTPKATNPATGQQIDARDGTPLASSTTQAGAGAHRASLKAAYRSGRISLTADQNILNGTKTVYPVYIDPTFTASGQTDTVQAWAFVDSYWPDNAYWKPGSSTPGPLHVGYEGWQTPYSTNRAFFQTSVHSTVWDATVISSSISFYENYSPSCTATPVDLYRTGTISSSTTWNNQPAWISKLGSDNVAYGWSTSCGPHDVSFDIKSTMQSAATGHWANTTFGLRADDESDMYGWKQFSNQATITTTYDHTPNTPTTLTTSPATDCTASSPTVLGLGDVTLHAAVSDPDGTTSPLTANFTLKNLTSGATYTQAINATSGTTAEAAYSHTNTSGPFQPLTTKTEFAWYLTVTDQYLTSSQSATCHFYYDPTAPGAPTITPVTSTTSQCNDLSTDNTDHLCTIGTAAGFTITDPNTTTTAPTSYVYQLNGGNPITEPASGSSPYTATISLKPTEQTNTLTVTAVGASGNVGDTQDFRFIAQPPATASSDDMNGDGHADLVTVGGQNGLPAGLWQADGSGSGLLNPTARNIGIDGNGVSTTQTATSFNNTQTITGHFFTGAGFNDVLDYSYNPGTGAVSGEILRGQGDGSVLNPVASLPVTNATGVFTRNNTVTNPDGSTTTTTSYATSIASGGGLFNAVNSNPITGYPDLLLLINGSLYDEPSNVGTGSFPGADNQNTADLADVNPYCLALNAANGNKNCTTSWNGWTITSTLLNGMPAVFARDTSTSDASAGQLWYLSAATLNTLEYDSLSNSGADASATGLTQAASTGWDSTTVPTLQAADINGDGTPDLWTINATGTATAHLMTLNGTTATWTTPGGQMLSTATHSWPLSDYSTTTLTAGDTGTNPQNLTGQSGVSVQGDGLYGPAVSLNGTTSSYLNTTGSVLDLTKSFTVSVWAEPQTYGGAVFSQDGSTDSGIFLVPTTSGWQYSLNTGAGTAWTFDSVWGGTVHLGSWSHLTATYDATAGVMNLYVDDVFVGTGNHTAPSTGATGKFQVGDDLDASRTGWFTGQLSNLETWSGASVPPAQPTTAASYHQALTPTRIVDTRVSSGLTNIDSNSYAPITAGTNTVEGGSTTVVKIATDPVTPAASGALTAIPSTVTAVAVDITATNETGTSFVTGYADGTQRPITSSTNFTPSDTVTGYQIVPVGNDGKIAIRLGGSANYTSALIVDLTGYFTSDATATGDQTYTPLATATRALDTRASIANTTGLTSTGNVPNDTAFTLTITGQTGVPSNATAVAVNLTAANESGTGYLEAYATGSAPSADTSLSFNTSSALASMSADVPIGTGGSITIYVHTSTAVIADISGYYTTSTTGQTFHTINPTRLVDTRSGIGGTKAAVASFGTYNLTGTTTRQVTTAYEPTLAAQVTVTDTSGGAGSTTVYPTAGGKPGTSNLNWPTGGTLANLTLTPTDSNGQISIYNNSYGAVDFVVDSNGFFA